MRRAPRPALPLLALTVLALLAPLAQAQVPPLPGGPGSAQPQVRVELQDPGEALVPARPYSLVMTIHYIYPPGGSVPPDQATPPPSGQVCGSASVVQAPPWANVSITPAQVCFRLLSSQSASGSTATNTTIVEINATRDAPALEPFNFTVRFEANAAGTLAAASGEASQVVAPAYFGRIALVSPGQVVVQGGSAQQVWVTVRNLGNGPALVTFRNATAPQGMRLDLPPPLLLPVGEERVVFATVRSPWTAPVRGDIAFTAEPVHPEQPALAGEVERTRVSVQGNAAVPGPGAALLVGAVGALAVALRRR
jgi:hypothetical protein